MQIRSKQYSWSWYSCILCDDPVLWCLFDTSKKQKGHIYCSLSLSDNCELLIVTDNKPFFNICIVDAVLLEILILIDCQSGIPNIAANVIVADGGQLVNEQWL